MFHLICTILFNILVLLTTTTNADQYINVPKLLQSKYQERIAYDRHTPTRCVMISKNEPRANGIIIEKKIYTCRIGGFSSEGFADCFPFPSHGAIPKYGDMNFAKNMCKNLAEMYVAYFMGGKLVWCNKPSAQAIPNGAVKVLQVPKPLDYEFGKTVIYDYRSMASYQNESFNSTSLSDRTDITVYKCRIGEFNFTKDGVEELMVDCPYPSKKKSPKSNVESSQITLCKDYASTFLVYWLDGRIVFCIEQENHTESDLVTYHRGRNILNLNFPFWSTYGDKIYYDKTNVGGIVQQIVEVSEAAENRTIHKCIIGGLDSKNEFSVCFPQRSEQKIRTSSHDEAKNQCEALAKIYQLYWENDRLVWCEIKKEKKRPGRKPKIKIQSGFCVRKPNNKTF